jgi:hypothetical protein
LRREHAAETIPLDHRHPTGLMDQHLREGVVQRSIRPDYRIEGTSSIPNPGFTVGRLSI